MIIIKRKRIKINGRYYYISVRSYDNNRLKLIYENNSEMHDITLDLPNTYLENGKVFLDPFLKKNGVLKQLKKKRIIREICSSTTHHSMDIPIATLNMGILREFDFRGVQDHLSKVENL